MDLEVTVDADVSSALSKLAALKARVGQLVETQQGLKTSIKALNTEFTNNEKKVAELTATMSKLGSVAGAKLKPELDKLKLTSKNLSLSLNEQKLALANTTKELNIANKAFLDAEKGTTGFGKGAGKAFNALKQLANIIPGLGISGILLLVGGPIVDAFTAWAASMIKVVDTSKLLQKVNEKAAENVGKEIGNLKILKAVVEDVNAPMALRLQGVKDLKKEFPDLFTGLTNEQILTGNVGKAYDFAAAAIFRKARADAAAQEIQKNAAKDFAIVQKGIADAAKINKALAESSGSKIVDEFGRIIDFNADLIKGFKDREAARHKERLDIQKENEFLIGIAKQAPEQLIKIEPPPKEKVAKTIKALKDVGEALRVVTKLENKPVDKPALLDFSQVTPLDPAKLQDAVDSAVRAGKLAAARIAEAIQEAFEKEVAQGIADIATGLAEAVGNALSGKGGFLGNILGSVFEVMGTFLINLGKATIVASQLVQAISKLFVKPAGGLIAGIAAVAAGTILKNIKLPEFATGGFVSGPGTAKSDSIPARLSNGEYVMSASTVSRFGKSFFDMINSGGRPRNGGFADGGPVGGIGGGQLITVEVVGRLRGKDIYFTNIRAGQTIGRNG